MDLANNLKEKGNKEFSLKNYQKAIDLYSQAIAIQNDASFYANRAMCYLNTQQYQAAADDCKRAIELDPEQVKPYYRLAKAYTSLGELQLAFETLKRGCTKHSQELNMRREYDNIQILIGYRDSIQSLIDQGDFAEALKKTSSILEQCEMFYEMLIKKIELLCKTNDPKGALALLKQRQTFISSKSPTKYVVLNAMIDRYMNQVDSAKTKLKEASKRDPTSQEVKSELKHITAMEEAKLNGNKAFAQKKFEEAIKYYDECFVLDPYNSMWKSVILSNKASCHMALKNIKSALEIMKLSTALDPNNAKNMYKRGKLEKDLKEWEAALNSMKKAKSMDSTLNIEADIKQISEELKKEDNKDYYQIMGLSRTATNAEIKKAYKELVRKYHPDRNTGNKEEQEKAEKMFKLVNEANEVLSDPVKKKRYDDAGCKKTEEGMYSSGAHQGFGGMDPNDLIRMFFSEGQGNPFGGFGDFTQMGGGSSRGGRRTQGASFVFRG